MAIKPTDVYGSLSKTIEDTLKGAGAIKGAPCTIKSIEPITGGNRVTFSWKDTSNVEHTQTMDVMNGEKGDSPDLSQFYTKTEVDSAISTAIGGALNGTY